MEGAHQGQELQGAVVHDHRGGLGAPDFRAHPVRSHDGRGPLLQVEIEAGFDDPAGARQLGQDQVDEMGASKGKRGIRPRMGWRRSGSAAAAASSPGLNRPSWARRCTTWAWRCRSRSWFGRKGSGCPGPGPGRQQGSLARGQLRGWLAEISCAAASTPMRLLPMGTRSR